MVAQALIWDFNALVCGLAERMLWFGKSAFSTIVVNQTARRIFDAFLFFATPAFIPFAFLLVLDAFALIVRWLESFLAFCTFQFFIVARAKLIKDAIFDSLQTSFVVVGQVEPFFALEAFILLKVHFFAILDDFKTNPVDQL